MASSQTQTSGIGSYADEHYHLGLVVNTSACNSANPIGIFWDLHYGNVISEVWLHAFVQKLRTRFCTTQREVKFVSVKKKKNENDEDVASTFLAVNVHAVQISAHSNATTTADVLTCQLHEFAKHYPAPATVLIISDNIEFSGKIVQLRNEFKLHVIIICDEDNTVEFDTVADEVYSFSHFAEIHEFKNQEESSTSTEKKCTSNRELLIDNVGELTVEIDREKLTHQLQKLVDRFNGHVLPVFENLAYIKFNKPKQAKRAYRSLCNQTINGTLISVKLPEIVGSNLTNTKNLNIKKIKAPAKRYRKLKAYTSTESQTEAFNLENKTFDFNTILIKDFQSKGTQADAVDLDFENLQSPTKKHSSELIPTESPTKETPVSFLGNVFEHNVPSVDCKNLNAHSEYVKNLKAKTYKYFGPTRINFDEIPIQVQLKYPTSRKSILKHPPLNNDWLNSLVDDIVASEEFNTCSCRQKNDFADEQQVTSDSPQLNQPRAIRAKQQNLLTSCANNSNQGNKPPQSPDGQGHLQQRNGRFNNRTPTKKQYGDGRMSPQYSGTWRYSPRDGVPKPYNPSSSNFSQESRVPRNLSFSFSYDGFEDGQGVGPYPPQTAFNQPQHPGGFGGRSPHQVGGFHSPSPLPWRCVAPPPPPPVHHPPHGYAGYDHHQNPVSRGFPNPYTGYFDPQIHNFRKTPGASRPSSRSSTGSAYSTGSSGYRGSPLSGAHANSYQESISSGVNVFQPIRNGANSSKVLTASDLCGGIPEEGSVVSDTSETESPVELMVSNLDYNISAREWKKILFTEFQQQVQVIGVHILTQPDNTSLAYVRLATIDEARYAISQFHRKKIGYKRIHVSLVDNSSGEQAPNVRSEIAALLQEVSGNRLPLFKFIEIYEKRYHRTISVSELYRMRDLIEIQEMDGTGRMVVLINQNRNNRNSPTSVCSDDMPELLESPVCKTHCKQGSKWYVDALDSCCLPHVQLCLKHFAPQVHTMLQGHEGSMPIMSFPACYENEFNQTLKMVPEGGVSLEHLISCVPGVNVAVTKSGVKKVQWAENKPPSPIVVEWGKQCASPLLSNQLSQFSREVVDLLRQYPQCRMPFSKFIPSYHHHFGRQCRVADYGYTKLMELFEAIPHIVQIIGGGSRRYVTLSHRAQVKRFTSDLLRVLKSQSSKQIGVIDLPIVYNKIVGKKFDIPDYGTCYLEDMLAEVPENTILVEGNGKDMVIALPRREQTPEELERMKQLSLEVIDLLKNSPQCQMPFNKFIPAYHHHFGKQCRVSDYGFTKLIELFEAIPSVVDMVDQEGEKILVLTGPELLKVLEEHATSLLKASPSHQLPVPEFLAAYMRHHGHSLSLQDYGVSSVVQLITRIPTVAKVEENEGRLAIALVDNSHIEQLAKRVLMVLMDKIEGKLIIPDLQTKHLEKFGIELSDDDIMLLSEQKDFIEMSIQDNENVIKLSCLQQFARDVRTLLRVHQGRLALNTFEAAYAHHFGVSLVPASYGYPSVVALLQAIPHMATIRGKGYRRTVLLSQDFQDKVSLSGSNIPSPVPGEFENSIHTPSNDSGVIESQDEDEYMCHRRSPFDVLAPGIHSPDLQQMEFRRPQLDLLQYDPAASSGYADILSMSGIDKEGMKHSMCKTPVSEMLHLASQLLPPDHLPPQQPIQSQAQSHHPTSTAFYSQHQLGYMDITPPPQPQPPNISSCYNPLPSRSCNESSGYTYHPPPTSSVYSEYSAYNAMPSLTTAASLLPDIPCFALGNDGIGLPPQHQQHPQHQQQQLQPPHEYLYPAANLQQHLQPSTPHFQRRQRYPIKIEKPDMLSEKDQFDTSVNVSQGSDHDSGSPNSQKLGTPRRSRLAARFNMPLSPSSVDRRE